METVDHQSPQTEMEDGEFVPELALSSVEDEKARKLNNNGRICDKKSSTKKTLGGHMRVRLNSPKNPPKMIENDDSEMGDGKIQKCWVCGKSFSSLRSLCGHMGCHPAGERRVVRPPEKNPPPSSSSNGTEGVDEEAYGAACGLMLIATGEERYKLSPKERKKRKRCEVGWKVVCRCDECGKSFGSHEAVGGHMSGAHTKITMMTTTVERVVVDVDLNELPPEYGGDDGDHLPLLA